MLEGLIPVDVIVGTPGMVAATATPAWEDVRPFLIFIGVALLGGPLAGYALARWEQRCRLLRGEKMEWTVSDGKMRIRNGRNVYSLAMGAMDDGPSRVLHALYCVSDRNKYIIRDFGKDGNELEWNTLSELKNGIEGIIRSYESEQKERLQSKDHWFQGHHSLDDFQRALSESGP